MYRDEFRHGVAPKRGVVGNSRGKYDYIPDPRGIRMSDVWSERITASRPHPHAKPIGWLQGLITNCAMGATTVIDPFAGSGAVAVAAFRAGMAYLGCEIDESTHSSAVRYISMATGSADDFHLFDAASTEP